MAVTYDPIATTTLGSAQASVTLSSIPSTYTDLILIIGGVLTTGSGDQSIFSRVNGDTAGNYSGTYMYGYGGAAYSGRDTNTTYSVVGRLAEATYGGVCIIQYMNYSNTTTYKTVIGRGNDTNLVIAAVGLWRSTAAINSVTVYPENAKSFATGCVFTLYGVKSA